MHRHVLFEPSLFSYSKTKLRAVISYIKKLVKMGPKHVLIAPASPYQDGRPTSSRSNLSSPDPRLTPFVPPEYSGARPMPPGSMLPHEEAQLQAEHQRKRSASIQACSSDPKRQSLELTRPFEQLMAQPQGPHTGPLITEKIYQNRDTEEPLNKFLLHRFVKETPGWLTSSGSKRFECCTHVNRTVSISISHQ